MTNENIRICRLYCGFSYEDTAAAVKIPLNRYKNIELGNAEPADDEIEKIARLYNVSADELKNGFREDDKFRLVQEVDENFFESEDLREAVKLAVTFLSAEEKKLIMLIRSSENPEDVLEKFIGEIID